MQWLHSTDLVGNYLIHTSWRRQHVNHHRTQTCQSVSPTYRNYLLKSKQAGQHKQHWLAGSSGEAGCLLIKTSAAVQYCHWWRAAVIHTVRVWWSQVAATYVTRIKTPGCTSASLESRHSGPRHLLLTRSFPSIMGPAGFEQPVVRMRQ